MSYTTHHYFVYLLAVIHAKQQTRDMAYSRRTPCRWRRRISRQMKRGIWFLFPGPDANKNEQVQVDQSPLLQRSTERPHSMKYNSRGERCSDGHPNNQQRSTNTKSHVEDYNYCQYCSHSLAHGGCESEIVRGKRPRLICMF